MSIKYSFPEEAMAGNSDSKFVKLVQKIHDRMYIEPLKIGGKSGTSDASKFIHAQGNYDIVQIGPGNDNEHQVNKNTKLEVFLKAIKFYKEFARAFLPKLHIQNSGSIIFGTDRKIFSQYQFCFMIKK